jgi:hypothetical protein
MCRKRTAGRSRTRTLRGCTESRGWNNFEAISIWALEKGWDSLPERYGARSHDLANDLELKGWMAIAIALRKRFDDGLLHALRPTPLR